jgi:hypothetical protein
MLVGLEELHPHQSDDLSTSSSSSSSSSSSAPVRSTTKLLSSESAPGCTRIEKLVLHGCFLLTPAGLLQALPVLNLRSLNLGANTNITNECLKSLVPFLPNLTSLCIANCSNVTGTCGPLGGLFLFLSMASFYCLQTKA